jgi:hypothetical protein
MKQGLKYTFTCVIIAAGAILATPARAANEHYLSAQMAFADVNIQSPKSNGTALVATYGLPLARLHDYLGLEIEYTKSINSPDYDTPDAELDYYTTALYALMTVPIRERISLRARAGVLYENWEYHDDVLGDESDTAVELSIGGGAIYNLNEYLNLIAEATVIESNIIYTSAGMQLKF